MTYSHKRIKVSLNGEGDGFKGSSAGGSFVFEGLRTSARITKAGGVYMGTGEIVIYGLSMDHINELSTWGTMYHPSKNYMIAVEAGDPVNGMSLVFFGVVKQAWADFTNMPDVPMYFVVVGSTAPMNVGTFQPTSWSGGKSIPDLVKPAVAFGGMTLEANGVDTVLQDGYHWGSPWKQIKEIADAGNVDVFQDDGVVTMWKKGETRQGDTLLVSSQTGLRDYPSFTEFGVLVKVEFKKAIKYGTKMEIQSDLPRANGVWQILQIDYDLAAETPNGNWFAILSGAQIGAPITGLLK